MATTTSAAGRTPATPAATVDTFRARAAQACAEAINARTVEFTEGRDAMLDAVLALRSGDALSADTVDLAVVQTVVDELADTGEALLAPSSRAGAIAPAESAASDDVIADVDEHQAWIAERITALEAGDQPAIEAAVSGRSTRRRRRGGGRDASGSTSWIHARSSSATVLPTSSRAAATACSSPPSGCAIPTSRRPAWRP